MPTSSPGYLLGFGVCLRDAFSHVELQHYIRDGVDNPRSSCRKRAGQIAPLANMKPFGGPVRGR